MESQVTVCSCAQSWAATANHKIKCLSTFKNKEFGTAAGAQPEGFARVCIYTSKQADTSDFQSSPIKRATLTSLTAQHYVLAAWQP